MPGFFKNKLSSITIFLIVILFLFKNYDLKYWQGEQKVVVWDIISYYAYLPATLIQHDLALSFYDKPDNKVTGTYWPRRAPNGKLVIITSMGMSFLYSPFFILSHWYAKSSHYTADGFSTPYYVGILLSSVFFLFLGLIYLKKLLKPKFDELTISIVLIIITLGTNMWASGTLRPAMPHNYNFALITMFLYYIIKWHTNPKIKTSLLLGFLAGLISLIRPTNIIIALVFVLWDVAGFKDIKNRFNLLLKNKLNILLIIITAFLVWIPQLLYWKMQTGQYLYYSYGDSEKFFWNNPQILNVLFSYRKGWLIYTPIMLFSLAGLYFVWKDYRKIFFPILLLLIVHLYIISSWWCWWWGGSFSQRVMIDIYGILAIPLAFTVHRILQSKGLLKVACLLMIVFFIYLNFFQTRQYKIAHLHWDSMTKEAYWAIFLKHSTPANYGELLKQPDYEKARFGE
ncbi:MAG: hypothetical protein JXB49_19475 [Bacteroidales bacterium]|nr:hypothetical protein [Bacteroidales bacterium]